MIAVNCNCRGISRGLIASFLGVVSVFFLLTFSVQAEVLLSVDFDSIADGNVSEATMDSNTSGGYWVLNSSCPFQEIQTDSGGGTKALLSGSKLEGTSGNSPGATVTLDDPVTLSDLGAGHLRISYLTGNTVKSGYTLGSNWNVLDEASNTLATIFIGDGGASINGTNGSVSLYGPSVAMGGSWNSSSDYAVSMVITVGTNGLLSLDISDVDSSGTLTKQLSTSAKIGSIHTDPRNKGNGVYLTDVLFEYIPPIEWSGSGVSNVTTTSAVAYATLESSAGESAATATVYWATSDLGETHTGWLGTNSLGSVSTGLVEGVSMIGLDTNVTYYYRFYATNSTVNYADWSAAASFTTLGVGEWVGASDDLWDTAANWAIDSVPDTSTESALFRGFGQGDVDWNGADITVASVDVTAGSYSFIDSGSGSLTVTGLTEVSGGTLELKDPNDFSSDSLELSGGTLSLQGAQSLAAQSLTNNFETGDLSKWNIVATSHGDDSIFRNGAQPTTTAQEGSWGVRTYTKQTGGNADSYTGIIETDSFLISSIGTVTFYISAGNHPFTGDPDSPDSGMACVTLEKQVSAGDWEMVESSTHSEGSGWTWHSRSWDTTAYVGETVRIRIYDTETGGWGHTSVDDIRVTGASLVETAGIDMTNIPVVVSADSSVSVSSDTNNTQLGSVSITNNSTLTLSGTAGTLTLKDVTIADDATSAGFNTSADVYATDESGLEGSSATATIAKTGSGDLILNKAGSNLGNATFDVQAGTLVGVNATAFGASDLELGGGTLELSSPGGNVVYDYPLAVDASSTLAAGAHGGGVSGPLTLSLGSLGNDVTVSSGTLTVNVTDSYTLELRGNQTGSMDVNGAVSLATTATNLGSVTLSSGTMTANADLEVVDFISAGGSFAQSGAYDLTVSDNLTLSANLNMSSANLYVSNAVVTVNSGATLTDDVDPMVADSWVISGSVSVPGALEAATKFGFEPTITIANELTGSGYLHAGDADTANGYVALTASNSYTGKTTIERAALQADEGWGVPTNSLIEFSQDSYDQTAVFETSGTFERTIANSAGNNVFWSNHGGFSALGGDLIVTLNGGASLDWGHSTTGLNSKVLQFGSTTADSKVELTNPIDLNSSTRYIQICDNTSTTGDYVRLSGNITGSANNQSLRFNQNSGNNFYSTLIELTGTNTYSQRTHIDDATVFALPGAGLSTNSRIYFSGNNEWREAILMSSGLLELTIKNEDATGMYVSWQEERGGFAAKGGALTIDLTREDLADSPLDWSASDNGFAGRGLQLNSQYADSLVEIINDIELDATRYVYVWDNDQTDQDVGKLSGTISQDGSNRQLRKRGGYGTLWLTGTNTYAGDTFIDDGAVRAIDEVGLPLNSQLYFEGDSETRPAVFESSGTFERDIQNSDGNYVYWGQHGGFAAYGGPLTVNLEGGIQLNWRDANTGFAAKTLHLGSRTANDVVTIANDIDGQNNYVQLCVFDNPHSSNDYSRFTGELTGFNQFRMRGDSNAVVVIENKLWTRQDSNSDYIQLYGGTLKIAAGATLVSGQISSMPTGMQEIYMYDQANMIVNGSVTSSYFEVQNNASYSRKLSGAGTFWIRDRFYIGGGGTMAPGDNSVGTMSFTFYNGSEKLQMGNNSTYEWELGDGSSDLIAVDGKLDLDTWTLKLMDAGGEAATNDEFNIFTYTGTKDFSVSGDEVQNITIDTNSLDGAIWDASAAVVKFDESGATNRVYITGLAVTQPAGPPSASVFRFW